MMVPVDPEKPWEQEVSFTPSEQGSFSLHIWTEFTTAQGAQERSPVQGSPYTCTVAAGLASSEVSFVDGWTKETRQVDKNGKALEINDKIIAGDAVICQPIICDALGNKTVPSAGQLQVSLALPNGTAVGIDHSSLKLIETTKGGMTSFTVRHDVQMRRHKMQIHHSRPIRWVARLLPRGLGGALREDAKLTPPPENTLYRTVRTRLSSRFRSVQPTQYHRWLARAGGCRSSKIMQRPHDARSNNHARSIRQQRRHLQRQRSTHQDCRHGQGDCQHGQKPSRERRRATARSAFHFAPRGTATRGKGRRQGEVK